MSGYRWTEEDWRWEQCEETFQALFPEKRDELIDWFELEG